jgi:putative redox protein
VDSGSVRYAQKTHIGPHVFQADESTEHGGNDAGPNPEELLLAALGTCAGITVQMYAERKQWPLKKVHVHLSYVGVPVASLSGKATQAINGIEVSISFDGDLSEGQRCRLLEIAGRCPVHRLLTSQIPIRTSLADSRGCVSVPSSPPILPGALGLTRIL